MRGVRPRVVESGLGHFLDDLAEWELPVVVGVEVSSLDPTGDFLVSESHFDPFAVSDELLSLVIADESDFSGFAAVTFQVISIDHEEFAIFLFECGEGESA